MTDEDPHGAAWCPLHAALELLGRSWMLRTIRELLDGPRHFVELRVATGCPSPSTLTSRLRQLESEGMVAREVLSSSRPSVRYRLSDKGHALGRVLGELSSWAEQWLEAPNGDAAPAGALDRVLEPT